MDDLIEMMGLTRISDDLPRLLYEGQNWLYAELDPDGRVRSCNRLLNGKSVVGLMVDQVIDMPGDMALPLNRLQADGTSLPLIVRWQAENHLYEAAVRCAETGCIILGHRFLLSDEHTLGTSLMLESFDLRRTIEDREQEIRRLNSQIFRMMGSDPLTGLANEARFMDVLETEIRVAQRHNTALSIIGCDLDYFRSINETFGREMGDAVLVRLADVLRRFLRREDLAARYRSVLFFVVLPRTTQSQAFTLAERIRLYLPSVHLESDVEKQAVNLSASFSVCQYHPGEGLSDFLGRSQEALGEAKRHGRNCTVSAE